MLQTTSTAKCKFLFPRARKHSKYARFWMKLQKIQHLQPNEVLQFEAQTSENPNDKTQRKMRRDMGYRTPSAEKWTFSVDSTKFSKNTHTKWQVVVPYGSPSAAKNNFLLKFKFACRKRKFTPPQKIDTVEEVA